MAGWSLGEAKLVLAFIAGMVLSGAIAGWSMTSPPQQRGDPGLVSSAVGARGRPEVIGGGAERQLRPPGHAEYGSKRNLPASTKSCDGQTYVMVVDPERDAIFYILNLMATRQVLQEQGSNCPLTALVPGNTSDPLYKSVVDIVGTRLGFEYRHFEIDDLLAILSTKGYPDSHSKLRTFIKLGLFGHVLAEWRKVVFIDSDMLPVENIDALFDVPHKLAMGEEGDYEFNSGIMVIETPALDTFAAIKREMAAMPRYSRDLIKWNDLESATLGGVEHDQALLSLMAHRGLLDVASLPIRYNHRTVYQHKALLQLSKFPAVDSSLTLFRHCLYSKVARAPAVIHFTHPKPWMYKRGDFDNFCERGKESMYEHWFAATAGAVKEAPGILEELERRRVGEPRNRHRYDAWLQLLRELQRFGANITTIEL